MVGLSLGGAAFLIPKDKELIARVATDLGEKRIADLVEQQQAANGSGKAGNLELSAEIQESERFVGVLESVFARYDFAKLGPNDFTEIFNIASATDHPAECWQVLFSTGRFAALKHGDRVRLGSAIAAKALSLQKSPLAGEIYRHTVYPEKEASTELLQQAAKVLQFTKSEENQDATLRVLNELDSRAPVEGELLLVYSQLILEDGRVADAYAKARAAFDRETNREAKEKLLAVLIGCMNDAGREAELPDLTRVMLQTMPETQLPPEELVKLDVDKVAGFAKRAFEHAQSCEWAKPPLHDEAILFHTKAALCGHVEALNRAQEITQDLGRTVEFLSTLRLLVPKLSRPDLKLLLAQSEAAADNYPAAEPIFASYLKQVPNDHNVHFQHGCLLQELKRVDEAVAAFRKAIAIEAGLLEYHTALTGCLIQQGKAVDALTAYRAIPSGIHDQVSLENWMLLAEAEGDLITSATLMAKLMQRKPSPEAWEYKDLADVQLDAGFNEEAFRTLNDGLKVWPNSSLLRCAIGDYLLGSKKFAEVRKLMIAGNIRGDLRQAVIYVDALSDIAENSPEIVDGSALAALGPDYVNRPWTLESLKQLGHLANIAGRRQDSERIYTKALQSGSKDAVLALLDTVDEEDPKAMRRLGEVLASQGYEKEAQEAYRKSLQLLLDQAGEDEGEEEGAAPGPVTTPAGAAGVSGPTGPVTPVLSAPVPTSENGQGQAGSIR